MYKSAEYYFNRIQAYKPDQKRLKAQLLGIFPHEEEGEELVTRLKNDPNDGLLVSVEVGPNHDMYRCLREALESRDILVPVTIQNKVAG